MTTLYVTEPYSIIKKDGETLVVQIPANERTGTAARKVTVPLLKVTQVIIQGDSTLTTPALVSLLEQKVDICYLNYYGDFRGRLSAGDNKNGLLRLAQHQAHEDMTARMELARLFVRGKLHNMRTLLLRSNRKLNNEAITEAATTLHHILNCVDDLAGQAIAGDVPHRPQAGSTWGSLLGYEGAGSAAYFRVFGLLFNEEWGFTGRHRRPPTDPINALLSYGYTLLLNQVITACQIVGFDPYIGYLHSTQYGKPALGLDMMEEFRSPIVDSVVLTLLNNGMLSAADFEETMGTYRLSQAGRKTFLMKFEERLNTEIKHPVFEYKATYRQCLELQVRLLSKWLLADIPSYKPFVVR